MGRLYQRHKGGTFYGDYQTPEGKRVQRSLRTRDRAVAKERLRLAELGASPQARGRRQRLSDAIDTMIGTLHDKAEATREFYREKGRRILTSLGDPWIHEIDRDMLARYVKRRLDKADREHGRASTHTVAKELITVRRALREAVESGVLRAMPAFPRHSPKYKPRKTWLTPAQFEAVCTELKPERRLWAAIAALAGANLSEVEAIEWSDVFLAIDAMHVPGTKREARDRTVPLAPSLKHRLLEVDEKLRRGRVVRKWGNVRRDLRAAVRRANAAAAELAAERGEPAPEPIPFVSPNDLRRTFGSWLIQRGVPPMTIAVLMGHSSTRMVEQVYGKLAKGNLEAAIAMLPNLFGVGMPPHVPPEQVREHYQALPEPAKPEPDR